MNRLMILKMCLGKKTVQPLSLQALQELEHYINLDYFRVLNFESGSKSEIVILRDAVCLCQLTGAED